MSEFKSYQFTQDVGLSFASGPNERLVWEDRVDYARDSVHVFKVEEGFYGDYTLTTPEGRLIPGVCAYLLKEVNALDAPPSPAPFKRILEAFPAPVPGTQFGNSWELPSYVNSLRVVRDADVRSSLFDCSDTPVAYLRLVEGDGRRYDKLYYKCSFFGVPRRKVAKV